MATEKAVANDTTTDSAQADSDSEVCESCGGELVRVHYSDEGRCRNCDPNFDNWCRQNWD